MSVGASLALDWAAEEGAVWICPPFVLLPAVLAKLEQEQPAAILIAPRWPTAPWWPKLEQLGGTVREIPRPKHAVLSLHGRKVEPFLNHGLELIAMLLPKRN